MHATAAVADAAVAMFQLAWNAWSLTRVPSTSAVRRRRSC
jgi:hypothetical protein